MGAAKRWAEAILACSPMSVRASKQAALRGLEHPSLQSAIAEQTRNPAVRALLRSEDLREGALAFSQKRKPEWQGRRRAHSDGEADRAHHDEVGDRSSRAFERLAEPFRRELKVHCYS